VIELAEVFRRHGLDYLHKHGASMLPSHRRALGDIVRCRTPALGGHVYRCRACGREHYAYHSCRNRAYPNRRDIERWLAKRRGELLPVPYFHVVFTVPHILREVIRTNQKALYGVLMKAAATGLIDLARDTKHLGATVGVLTVLHTWGRTLVYHPHVHCLVTAGGVSSDGEHWVPTRKDYLVPVRALSRLFRGRFLALAKRLLPEISWPKSLWDKEWVVYCQPPMRGPAQLLQYLGRYVHRVALTNGRIVQVTDDHVRFRYKPVDGKRWRTLTLEAEEFIRRFLQHVPPKGTHKVRSYGLWASSNRQLLRRVQLLLGPVDTPDSDQTEVPNTDDPPEATGATHRCPYCGSPRLVHLRPLPKIPRGPPCSVASAE
jgi:DNA-directed RNA polymerase subunit RPC12/RpoP